GAPRRCHACCEPHREALPRCPPDPPRHLSLRDDELLPKQGVLGDETGAAAHDVGGQPHHEPKDLDHAARSTGVSVRMAFVARTGQRSYVETNPTHLLSGMLRCGCCGHAMGQVSGKGSGYYGCLAATKNACDNKLLVPRRLTERRLLSAVRERLDDAEAIRYVLERVKVEIARLHADLPDQIKLKR